MSTFLIIGAVAWDRPLWLSAPLRSGARLFATAAKSDRGLPAGRLGGGAANAATALINSGHHAALYSSIPEGPQGDQIIATAREAGCDMRYVARTQNSGKETLLLIEPNGERIVMGYALGDKADLERYQQERAKIPAPSSDALRALNPDGIYLRSALPDHARICADCDALVLAHWPLSGADQCVADVIVGSADDLKDISASFATVRSLTGGRLKWLVVTRGSSGGTAFGLNETLSFEAPTVQQVDATGAGDCFAAGLLDALCAGADMHAALNHAACWGAITAGREGSAIINRERVYPPYFCED